VHGLVYLVCAAFVLYFTLPLIERILR